MIASNCCERFICNTFSDIANSSQQQQRYSATVKPLLPKKHLLSLLLAATILRHLKLCFRLFFLLCKFIYFFLFMLFMLFCRTNSIVSMCNIKNLLELLMSSQTLYRCCHHHHPTAVCALKNIIHFYLFACLVAFICGSLPFGFSKNSFM